MDINFSLDKIHDVAKKILATTSGNIVYAFHGEMAAGKTTLIHAVCEALGITDIVTSPTFSIINEYNMPGGEIVYHMDLYRLNNAEDAIRTGVEDCLYSGNICLVEWPEKAPEIFPPDTIHIKISTIADEMRKIEW